MDQTGYNNCRVHSHDTTLLDGFANSLGQKWKPQLVKITATVGAIDKWTLALHLYRWIDPKWTLPGHLEYWSMPGSSTGEHSGNQHDTARCDTTINEQPMMVTQVGMNMAELGEARCMGCEVLAKITHVTFIALSKLWEQNKKEKWLRCDNSGSPSALGDYRRQLGRTITLQACEVV